METPKKNGNGTVASKIPSPGKARILVADDHPIFRQGMADLLNRQKDVLCCGEATTIHEIQNAIEQQKPDLVLLDLRLGTADGLEAIKTLKAQFAGLRILILSQFDETIYAERVLRAGACGYVMKEQATEEVLKAIRAVLGGDLYVSPKISMLAVARVLTNKPGSPDSKLASLSDRELHVFKALGNGLTNKEIAFDLNLSIKTIETYREHIKYKLGFANGTELIREAHRAVASDGILQQSA
jgi:DNA-binding NarL/FixJ family response regulator